MRIQLTAGSLLTLAALLPDLSSASGFNCEQINVDNYKYDLSALGGVHEVWNVERKEEYNFNTSYVLNICNILKGDSIRGDAKCGTSKNICGFMRRSTNDSHRSYTYAFPIVGLDHMGFGSKDPEITRLKTLDPDREGLLVKLAGGEYKEDFGEGPKKTAGAVIEFQCDHDRSGLEGFPEQEAGNKRRKARDENSNTPDSSLKFKSFGKADNDTYVLKLNWRTRYACDKTGDDENEDNDSSSHWGFFTWLIIIFFLCTAAYLIFGSWLNYTRYGARGWDLLPHGDTIRDIPYIFQDWLRSVLNTLQGTPSRGGYSAV